MRRMRTAIGVVILAAVIAVGYLHGQTTGTTPKYRVAKLERGSMAAAVAASGALNPVTTVQVGSQLSGQIKALYADYNTPVKKGQMIAALAPEIFASKVHQAQADLQGVQGAVLSQRALLQRARADVDNARAALAVAEAQTTKARVAALDAGRDLDRKRRLADKQLIALADRDTAQAFYEGAMAQVDSMRAQERVLTAAIGATEAQVEAAQAQLQSALAVVKQREAALAQARVDLDNTVIRAPVDGVVVSRNIDVGQTVAASLQSPTLFTIAEDLARMQVETNILEADIGWVAVGQRATFTVDAYPAATFQGEVIQIRRAPQLNQGVVSYNVVVSARNPDLKLLPGMTANVKILTAQKSDVLKVPVAALRVRISESEAGARAPRPPASRDGGEGVAGRLYVVQRDGSVTAVLVRLGITDGTAVELISGDVKEGQQVVVEVGEPRASRHGASAKSRL
jgi:HlyD family secretion protein